MKLNNYNVLHAIYESKTILFITYIIGFLLYKITSNKDYVLFYLVLFFIGYTIKITININKKFETVKNYILQYEKSFNSFHQIDNRFGYSYNFSGFRDFEIENMLKSKVKLEFIDCYKYHFKLIMVFVLMFISFLFIGLIN